MWFCLPKSAVIDDKTVEAPRLANYFRALFRAVCVRAVGDR